MRVWFGTLLTFTIVSLSLGSKPAEAKLMFGTQEQIRYVAPVELKGQSGERLFLGRKITTKAFLLPYAMKDDGYVLGTSMDTKRYIPLPAGPELEQLQSAGLLPSQLPAWKPSTLDLLFGYLLWPVLAILALLQFAKRLLRRGKA
jgi:hypothetical protein